MVRRDFSRAVPETFAMVDGHIATKRIIFLVQNLKRVGRDFTPSVPETFADGRMVDGHADALQIKGATPVGSPQRNGECRRD